MRHAVLWNKRDSNEAEIKLALAQIGVQTYDAGPLDFWCFVNQWIPCEVKTKDGRLTPGQKAFVEQCEALRRPYRVWRTSEEAIASIFALRGL